MIIIIGKKDKEKLMDIQAYVGDCGCHYVRGCKPDYVNGKILKEDCDKLREWLLKILGKEIKSH